MAKTISVLIPTLGRDKELRDTVTGLLNQTRVPDEIIITDQNGDDFPELDRFLSELPKVRHIKSSTLGLGFNANLALQHATGDVVLYVDDDIIPDSRLVEMHLENYEKPNPGGKALAGVAGRVEQPSGDLDPAMIDEVGVYHRWSGAVVANFNATHRCDVDVMQGCNMSFDRSLLNYVGGFDPGFDGNSYYIDSDGSLRVKGAGFRLIFDPRATLKHLRAPAGGCRVPTKSRHTFHFVKNGLRLYRKHSPSVGLPFFVARMFFYCLAKAAYNRDPEIFSQGLAGLTKGLGQSLRHES